MFGEFAIEEFSRSSSFGAKTLIGGDTLFGPNHVPPLEAAGWKELAGLRRPRLPGSLSFMANILSFLMMLTMLVPMLMMLI